MSKPRRLVFRPLVVGLLAEVFSRELPTWMRKLRGRSGVYVIRSRGGKEIKYVGESHTNRLHDTLTRHFRAWSGPTAGATYARGAVEVAFLVTMPSGAVELQNSLIASLNPSDNRNSRPDWQRREKASDQENPF